MKQRDQAYEAFIQLLLSRRLAPGAFVTQRELVELTGCPLGATREMIPRLEADGLIAAIPQRGLQIAAVDLRLVREAFQLREIIEGAAVSYFARSAPDVVIAAQRAAHDRIIVDARTGVTQALLADAQAVDWDFHNAIVEQMGNRLLSEVHRVNVVRIRVIMQERTTLTPEVLPPAFGEHGLIIAAIERRDAPAAVDALRAHLESARQRALGFEIVDDSALRRASIRRKA